MTMAQVLITIGIRRVKKEKDKGETAEYVGHLVELHKVQGAVLRLLQKTMMIDGR